MRVLSIIVVVLLAFSSVAMAEPDPVEFSFVAVKGTTSGNQSTKVFGPGLESVRHDIANLNYSNFQKLSSYSATINFGEPTTVPIDESYSLIVEPTAADKQGRIRLKTQVMMKKKSKDGVKLVKALDTVLVMAPGKRLNLGGLKLEGGGDLIIVLSVE